MAISTPSDLVLDVVRAADPSQVAAAQEQMKTNRANFLATSLAEKGEGFGATVDILNRTTNAARIEATAQRLDEDGKVPKPFISPISSRPCCRAIARKSTARAMQARCGKA